MKSHLCGKKFIFYPFPNKTPFRPIALSSALLKLMEYIIKIRFDKFLEHNLLIPNNLYSFCWGISIMEYLSSFVGPVFLQKIIFNWCKRSIWFCKYTHFCLKSASLNIPLTFCNFISSLFSQRFLRFTSPSGII